MINNRKSSPRLPDAPLPLKTKSYIYILNFFMCSVFTFITSLIKTDWFREPKSKTKHLLISSVTCLIIILENENVLHIYIWGNR